VAKPFKNLRDKMSPEARDAAAKKTQQLLAQIDAGDLDSDIADWADRLDAMEADEIAAVEVINDNGDIVIVPAANRPRAYNKILKLAVTLFETKDQAALWLHDRQYDLGNARPVDHMRTAKGAIEVEDLLKRIEHGNLA